MPALSALMPGLHRGGRGEATNQHVNAGDLLVPSTDRRAEGRSSRAVEADLQAALANAGEKGFARATMKRKLAAARARRSRQARRRPRRVGDAALHGPRGPRRVISKQRLDNARSASAAADATLRAALQAASVAGASALGARGKASTWHRRAVTSVVNPQDWSRSASTCSRARPDGGRAERRHPRWSRTSRRRTSATCASATPCASRWTRTAAASCRQGRA